MDNNPFTVHGITGRNADEVIPGMWLGAMVV